MQPRIPNPATLIPDALAPIQQLVKAAHGAGVPETTMTLVHLRVSQVNGCSACVASGVEAARKAGESEERLATVAAWREAPWYTDAERAALALAEAVTRLSDRADPVPEEVWAGAAAHFAATQLAGLVLWVAVTNLFNRVNVSTRQVAGAAW
jgi:AhpD family alkylhydroperoxidase